MMRPATPGVRMSAIPVPLSSGYGHPAVLEHIEPESRVGRAEDLQLGEDLVRELDGREAAGGDHSAITHRWDRLVPLASAIRRRQRRQVFRRVARMTSRV